MLNKERGEEGGEKERRQRRRGEWRDGKGERRLRVMI